MKKIRLIFGILIFSCMVSAQNYTRDAGIRIGSMMDFTYRQHYYDHSAWEGMLGIVNKGIRVTALREFFRPAFTDRSDCVEFVFGFGAHAGFNYANKYEFFFREYHYDKYKFSPVFGIDGLFGLEYRFREFPLVMSIDSRPNFEFSTNKFFSLRIPDLAVSIKARF